MIRILSLLICAVLMTGCLAIDPVLTFLAGENQQEAGKVPLAQSYSGSHANSAVQNFIIARSQPEWEALWAQLQVEAPGDLPRGKMAVAVLLGQRPSGGFRVEIGTVERNNTLGTVQKLIVKWREYRPSPNRMQTQDITSPWALRIVDSWPQQPEFSQEDTRVLE